MTQANPKDLIGSFLKRTLSSKQSQNPQYSLRAFARDLGLSPGRLSNIMSGGSAPGKRLAARIVQNMSLTPEETEVFWEFIEKTRKRKSELGNAHQLSESEFLEVSSWEHYAILSLMKTSDFRDDPSWIAARLGLSGTVVERALARLKTAKLVERVNGALVPTHNCLTTTHDISSQALRNASRQVLEQSILALDTVSPEHRDITSITVAIDPKNIPKAKALSRQFRRKLADLLGNGDKTEVYNLCVEIVPVTKVRNF
jgi:uncharacterized protein (TIGR02147 family)